MIRKEGKARWVFECASCEYTSPVSPDLLRAKEWSLKHNRANLFTHFGQAFAEAVKPLREAFDVAVEFAETVNQTFEPPKNLPHDPSLRNDRRKWGGR